MLSFQQHGMLQGQGQGQPQKLQDSSNSGQPVAQLFPNDNTPFDKRFNGTFSNRNVFQKGNSTRVFSRGEDGAAKIGNSDSLSTDSLSVYQKELKYDSLVGPFLSSSSFKNKYAHALRPLPGFLIYQPPILSDQNLPQDDWDRQNQAVMSDMELNTSDLTSIYEDFQKLREAERKEMENRGLVDKEDTRKTLEDAISFKGSCMDMCPVYERVRRSVENDVRKYEKDETTGKISKSKAIKAFSRPAAGQPPPLPSDVRPPSILVQTLNYIVDNILQYLPEAQSFIWDRTRSIRQDFTYQNYSGPEAVDCNERIVRIHIFTLHVMAKTQYEFSQQQELEQMNKALKSLSEIYNEYRSRNIQAPNEAEFRAYYLLSQLRDPELEREIQTLPQDILQNPQVQLGLFIRGILQTNIIERGFQNLENGLHFFVGFFNLLKSGQMPPLLIYLIEIHLNEIRFYAVKSLKRSLHQKSRLLALQKFQELFVFDDDSDARIFCDYYGLELVHDSGHVFVDISSLKYGSHLIPDQKPLKQAFISRFDDNIKSSRELINSGNDNSVILSLMSSSQPTNSGGQLFSENRIPSLKNTSSIASHASAPTLVPRITPIPASTSAPSAGFSFSFPQMTEKNEASKENEERDKLKREEEERKLKDSEAKLEKERQEKLLQLKLQQKREELEREKQKKEVQKSKIDKAITEVSQESLQCLLKENIKSVVYGVFETFMEEKKLKTEKRDALIQSLSQNLYEAFITELTYKEILNCVAGNFRERTLKRHAINKIKRVTSEILEKEDLKKRKREEFIDASKNFGIPRLIKRKKTKKEFPSTKDKTIDLSAINFSRLCSNFRSASSENTCEILVYYEDIDDVKSKYLRKKFMINNNTVTQIKENNVDLKIVGTNSIRLDFLDNVNILVFNCDGLESLKKQKLIFRELINGIALNSNYKIDVLIIFWEFDSMIRLSHRDIVEQFSSANQDIVLKLQVVKVDASLNAQALQDSIDNMGNQFEFTAKGRYNFRYRVQGRFSEDNSNVSVKPQIPSIYKSNNNEPLTTGNNNLFEKLRNHIEASPKVKKLPKLLFKSKDTSSSDPSSIVNSKSLKSHFDIFKPKVSKPKIDVYSTPRPKSSELVQTPSFLNESTASNISNLSSITFANQSISTPILNINKPTYAQVANSAMTKNLKQDEKQGEIPNSILELRKLAASVRERHGKK